MGVTTCQILMFKSPGVYYAGEVVQGVVRYIIDEVTEFKALTLSLTGTGQCKWKEYNLLGDLQNFKSTEEYVSTNIDLLTEKTLRAGVYTNHFKFDLPKDAPSSFKNEQCNIVYRIWMAFEIIDTISYMKQFNTEISVRERVKPAQGRIQFILEKEVFKLFSLKNQNIKLIGTIEKTFLSPGEDATIDIKVINETGVRSSITLDLYCKTTVTGKRQHNTTVKKVDHLKEIQDTRNFDECELKVYIKSDLFTINSNFVKREYILKAVLKLPKPHKNVVAMIPVAIGETKGAEHDSKMNDDNDASWEEMQDDFDNSQ